MRLFSSIDSDADRLPGALEVVAFICELGMFVLLGMAGWRLLDSTQTRAAALVALPVAVGIGWSIWLAPKSQRRLSNPARLIVQIILFAITAMLAASAGLRWWGVGWASITVVVFTTLAVKTH